MARPSTVDGDAVVQAVRDGAIAAEAARTFGITRMRVTQILKDKAPDLLPNKPRSVNKADRTVVSARRREAKAETIKVMKTAESKVDAARSLGLTVSGLNSRLRQLNIPDTLTREGRDLRQLAQTKAALKKFKTKTEAADHLGLTVSGLNSRIERWKLSV